MLYYTILYYIVLQYHILYYTKIPHSILKASSSSASWARPKAELRTLDMLGHSVTRAAPPGTRGTPGNMYIYIYIYMCVHTYYTHIHVYIYIYAYIYIYMYIQTPGTPGSPGAPVAEGPSQSPWNSGELVRWP